MNRRVKRVCEVMKRELGPFFQKQGWFPDVLVTVSDVDMTPDLKQAHVYLGVIGSEAQKSEVTALLERRRPAIQDYIARRVVLKYTPQLHFRVDDSVERGVRLLNLIDSIEIPDEIGDDESDTSRDG